MWENLPNHLKTGLTIALVMVVGVAIAGFVLSFVALREVAANPVTGWATYAWIFPLCLDAALIAAEVTYISAGMIRGLNRALPFACMVLFGAVTVWFNMERVPGSWRAVTAIPPIAGICMTLLIAYLVKALARVTGRTMTWDAPPAAYGALNPYGPIHGSIRRGDETDTGTSDRSRIGHSAQGGVGERGATTRAIRAVAANLTTDELTELGPEGVTGLVWDTYQVQTTPGYVRKVLDGRAGSGRNGHGKS